jgi:hypothetical protein
MAPVKDETVKKFGLDAGAIWLQVVAGAILVPALTFLFTYPVSCTESGRSLFLKSCTSPLGLSTSQFADGDEFFFWLFAALIGVPIFVVVAALLRLSRRS